MQIVIDIKDAIHRDCKEFGSLTVKQVIEVEKAIKNGIPLPEGHGRLIDATNLFKKLFINQKGEIVPDNDADNFEVKYGVHYVKMAIHEAPTIIDTYKEDKNGD